MDYNTYFSTEEKKIPPVIEKDIPISKKVKSSIDYNEYLTGDKKHINFDKDIFEKSKEGVLEELKSLDLLIKEEKQTIFNENPVKPNMYTNWLKSMI